ncbi:uncharacterized protein LOC135333867 [Halichondria panicea]|uniref:uncharacterized protein LOC135333867 n=1 Tax=Halichondria panicea TaxID=6063 RepID=UPI00312B7793
MTLQCLRALRINSSRLGGRSWSSFKKEWAAEEKHALTTLVTWKRISLFVGIPVVSYLTWKHVIVGEEHSEPREFFAWPHLRIRSKPFPWGDGDTSLFNNPHVNPGPEKDKPLLTETKTETFREKVDRLWLTYLHDDPVKRDEERWDHLRKMQKRKKEYLAKKKTAIDNPVPIQPMDLFTEVKYTPVNPIDSEMEN